MDVAIVGMAVMSTGQRPTQDHELSLSDVVLLLAFGSVYEVDGLGQAFLD